jgi:hypothetical protein
LEVFPVLVVTGKKNVVNQSRVPDVPRALVPIYRHRNFGAVPKSRFFSFWVLSAEAVGALVQLPPLPQ